MVMTIYKLKWLLSWEIMSVIVTGMMINDFDDQHQQNSTFSKNSNNNSYDSDKLRLTFRNNSEESVD